jgi:hypothetical protein
LNKSGKNEHLESFMILEKVLSLFPLTILTQEMIARIDK